MYYYSCYFQNKTANLYTYESTLKLEPGDYAVVPSPYGCGFSVVCVHSRLYKKEVKYDTSKLTRIVCKLKNEVDEKREFKHNYLCAVNGNRNNMVIVSSPLKLSPGDMVIANTRDKQILNVIEKTKNSGNCKLIQKLQLKRFEKNISPF